MMRLVDLSHVIEDGVVTYQGLPPPSITDFLSREESRNRYAPGTEFHIGRISMVANTGTYLDSPFHRFPDGSDLAGLELSHLANLDGVRIDHAGREISEKIFAGLDVSGKAVLINTGWSRHWRTPQYFEGHPYLTRDAARYLADHGAALVGIDSLNIDSTADGARPAHTLLLGAGIPIVEHLCNLSEIPHSDFKFFAVPAKVKSFGSFPVRAFAVTG